MRSIKNLEKRYKTFLFFQLKIFNLNRTIRVDTRTLNYYYHIIDKFLLSQKRKKYLK